MQNNRELSQDCKAPGHRRLLQLVRFVILGVTLFPIAEAHSAVLDRASSLFPVPLEQSNPWLSYQSAVMGDFDGDNQLDQANIKFSKNGYEINVTLRAHPGTGTRLFWPSSEPIGLGLITCDIDQDGDQDLFLTSPTSLFPLAIWISDGTGHFQEGDHAFYAPVFSNDRHPAFHPNKKFDKQICFPRQRRDSVLLSRGAHETANLEISSLGAIPSLAPLARPDAYSLKSRSPPKKFFL